MIPTTRVAIEFFDFQKNCTIFFRDLQLAGKNYSIANAKSVKLRRDNRHKNKCLKQCFSTCGSRSLYGGIAKP